MGAVSNMTATQIEENTIQLLRSLPSDVRIVAAAKTRSVEEVRAAIRGGIRIIGYNYVQEAERMQQEIGSESEVSWHFIGHLQRNKAKKAAVLFDMIETVDSIELASELDKRCQAAGIQMPVLIEINSGREENKSGVFPENAGSLLGKVEKLLHLRIQGLMTMGPFYNDPEKLRPHFRETRNLYDQFRHTGPESAEMRYLSMGMSESYHIAIEEGANMVRIGTKLFGPRST